MEKLSNPSIVSRLLEEHGIRLKKRWGQNFLVDENILVKIAEAAGIQPTETVLEIGPGIGSLTQKLAEKAHQVIAVEIDGRLLPVLEKTLAGYNNVEIVHQDALAFDPLVACGTEPVTLVANLPYNVATPLFYRWLKDYRGCFIRLVCMVQKEVAERITAKPGGKDYGALSVVMQFTARCEIAFDVPKTVFFPRPDVSSAVVRIIPRAVPEYNVGDEPFFYKVIDAVFAQRRKTLLNTLHHVFPITKEQLSQVGATTGIDMTRRGETLSVEEFAKLSRLLYNNIGGI